jgi:type IV pilus assembly protein PilE
MILHHGRRSAGFTIIELLIAIVIVGILAAVALPAFQNSVRKGRRSEAYTALGALQQAQERWRSSNGSYADNSQLSLGVNASPAGLGQAATTPSGYYAIAITAADGASYTATATAATGTSQADDSGCTVLAVRMVGGNIGYGSGATTDWTDAARCWNR